MTSLFLTGASGFLGSGVLEKLDPGRYETIVLLSRREITLPPHLCNAGNVKLVRASIEDVEQYAAMLNADTRIVHLAAVTGKASPEEYYAVNAEGTRILVEAAKAAGVSEFLLVSSIAVSFPDRKGYVYADSKELAEETLKKSGLRYCIFRPTIILGKGSPIWGSFVKLAGSPMIVLPGNGRVKIQPVYISDMADLLLEVVDKAGFNNEILEIGGPETLTMDDFVSRIHRAMKNQHPRIFHLPLGLLVASLRLFERVFPSLLPVNSGQFSSFQNDGTASGNYLIEAHKQTMKDVDAMLGLMLEEAPHG